MKMSAISKEKVLHIQNVLESNEFINPDVGPLNEIFSTDYFVIGPPKCGTTAIQRGLERAGQKVIHAHTNDTTYAAFPNGEILRQHDIGLESLIQARIYLNDKPIRLFFGYRDPISWYASLAGHFNIELTYELFENALENMKLTYPWRNYKMGEIFDLVKSITGVDIKSIKFNKKLGYTYFKRSSIEIIIYRMENLNDIISFVKKEIEPGFQLNRERVNDNAAYKAFMQDIDLPRRLASNLLEDEYTSYFYNQSEREALIDRYSGRTSSPATSAGSSERRAQI